MMSKSSYLTDSGQNGPHITFYVPTKDYAAWVQISRFSPDKRADGQETYASA